MSTQTTLLPNGINNAQIGSALDSYIGLDPTASEQYFNDFFTYATGDWTVTTTGASTGTGVAAGDGGILAIHQATAISTDYTALQLIAAPWTGAVIGGVPLEFWFKTRFTVADATNSVLIMGLTETVTTPFSAITDGIWFSKAGGATALDINAETGSATVFTPFQVGTMANNTYIVAGFHYDGLSGQLNININGNWLANVPCSITTAALNLQMAVQSNSNAAQTLSVDYIFAAKQRQPLS